MNYIIVIVLVLLSGVFSGLTLGMFSLSLSSLERKIRMGDPKARCVLGVRKRGNLLLCTLLLGNVAVNSAIAIFLGSIASGVLAGLIATGLIVIFGEIVPQAMFSRFALTLASKTAWLVKIFILLLYPVAKPVAWLLDQWLGEELPTIWSKKEIKEIIKYHEDSPLSEIDRDEERIALGALSFSDKRVKDVMTPKEVVFYLSGDEMVTMPLLGKIRKEGFTRIPVFKTAEQKEVGLLMTKDLLTVCENDRVQVWDVCRKKGIMRVAEEEKLDVLLNRFIKHKKHQALVFDDHDTFTGIVTLEDVIEEILKVEIVDELDRVDDLRKLMKR